MSDQYNNGMNEFSSVHSNNEQNKNCQIKDSQINESQFQDNKLQNNQYNTYNGAYQHWNNYDNPSYNIYPTPELKKDVKRKKKRRGVSGFIKLTAAAVLFGLISGAVFQGYISLNYQQNGVFQIDSKELSEDKQEELEGEKELSTDLVSYETIAEGIVTDVSDVVDNVMPSIVAINSSATVTELDFFGRRLERPVSGSGSGIIIGQNGTEVLIVTNNHVIEGAQQVEIVFADDSTATASVKGAEPKSDLAVVSVEMSKLSKDTVAAIKIANLGNSSEVRAGSMSIAIGNALGYGQSVTVGYISALNREVTIEGIKMTLLQTDAAINPGNSGGALLNLAGEVIGINSVKYAAANIEGMGYAIPISEAIPIINDLMNRKTLDRSEQGFLGVNLSSAQNVTDVLSKRFSMPVGIYINDVVVGSPAEKAGLQNGSIIVGIDNKKVETIDDIIHILSYTKAGEEVTLVIKVQDNGNWVEKTLQITLDKRPK